MTTPTRYRWYLLLVAALLLVPLATPVVAEDEKTDGDPAAKPPANSKPAKPQAAPPNDKGLDKIVEAAVQYFDLGNDLWKARKTFLGVLEPELKRGYDLMADMETLRKVVYRSRYFEPQMTDKKWRNEQEIKEFDNKGQLFAVKSDELSMAFNLPKKYPKKNKKLDKQPRPAPYPLLVSTVERSDVTLEKRPGWKLINRRYPKKEWGDLRENWVMLVPIAPGASYLTEDGRLKREYFSWQFVQFIRHYHVDFDRIILDGKQEVLQIATTAPMMYAGFVLRGGKLDDALTNTIVNFSHVPTYVTKGNEALAEALKKAGHENVTVGPEGKELAAWLKERKRVVPTKFTWRLEGGQHQFAHWVNAEKILTAAKKREIKVDVDRESNTINIEAIGVTELSLFLNDSIADLHGQVKVVVNGHPEVETEVKRTVDMLFDEDPFSLRESMYFGLLFPGRIANIGVRPPAVKKEEPKKPETPSASPEEEAEAKKYFDLVQKSIDQGLVDKAKKLLERVIKIGNTSYLERAKEWLAKLG